MKLIKSSFEILLQERGLDGVYKQIELAGRTCYKSEDKITETSTKEFIERMIRSGHGGILEHGTIYLKLDNQSSITGYKYRDNKYSRYVEIREREKPIPFIIKYITTNYRVIMQGDYDSYSEALENNFDKNWLSDLQYLCEPTSKHNKRVSVRFICDRGISHELVRHRVFSFAQESTRYCNYSKDKFNNKLTFIIPSCINLYEGIYNWEDATPLLTAGEDMQNVGYDDSANLWILDKDGEHYNKVKRHYEDFNITEEFAEVLQKSSDKYFSLLSQGWTPQQARSILPNALKTEVVMTEFISDWKEFFKLRTDKSAHPDARALAIPLEQEFIKLGYIKESK